MKKYLSKNILKIQISIISFMFSFLFLFPNVLAQTKLDYYKKLFSTEFGFKLSDVIKEEKEKSSTNNNSSLDLYNSYAVLLSSDISEEGDFLSILEKHRNIILICDNTYSSATPLSFSCDRFEVTSNQMDKTGNFLKDCSRKGEDIYVIPENHLASVEGRNDIQKYFNALASSDSSIEDFGYSSKEKNSLVGVSRLLETTTFEIFLVAISMFVFISVSFNFIKYFLSDNKRKLDLGLTKVFLLRLSDFFISHRWVIVYTLLVTVVMYIPIVIILSVKDGQGVSLGYFISYSLDTFKISNLVGYVDQANYTRVAIFFYNFVFLVTLAIFFIPYVINILIIASLKIVDSKLKSEVYKYAIPSLVIISLFTSLNIDYSKSPGFLILTITILLFIVIKGIQTSEYTYKYSLSEKGIFLLLAFITIIFSIFIGVRKDRTGPVYNKEDLVGVSDNIVVLPYKKDVGKNVLFKEHLTILSEPVFVNQYMVYSPINIRIENKNIREFKNEGSFFIQNGDVEDILLSIDSDENILNILKSASPTNFLKIYGRFYNEDKKIQITFSCEEYNLRQGDIKSNFYYLTDEGEVKKSEEIILHFPGCSKVGNPETYIVEFNPPYYENEYIFMELIDVFSSDIKDIEIISSNKTIEPIYFLKGSGFSIIASDGLTDSSKPVITNYIFGDSYDLSFDMNLDSEGKFDISKPINELVKEGVLKDNFLIWSTKKYLPIRLD